MVRVSPEGARSLLFSSRVPSLAFILTRVYPRSRARSKSEAPAKQLCRLLLQLMFICKESLESFNSPQLRPRLVLAMSDSKQVDLATLKSQFLVDNQIRIQTSCLRHHTSLHCHWRVMLEDATDQRALCPHM